MVKKEKLKVGYTDGVATANGFGGHQPYLHKSSKDASYVRSEAAKKNMRKGK